MGRSWKKKYIVQQGLSPVILKTEIRHRRSPKFEQLHKIWYIEAQKITRLPLGFSVATERNPSGGGDESARGFTVSSYSRISLQPLWPMSTSRKRVPLMARVEGNGSSWRGNRNMRNCLMGVETGDFLP
jgi:hypothetical protein